MDAVTTCDAEVIGRDGKPLDWRCNLAKGHLGQCAQTYDGLLPDELPTESPLHWLKW